MAWNEIAVSNSAQPAQRARAEEQCCGTLDENSSEMRDVWRFYRSMQIYQHDNRTTSVHFNRAPKLIIPFINSEARIDAKQSGIILPPKWHNVNWLAVASYVFAGPPYKSCDKWTEKPFSAANISIYLFGVQFVWCIMQNRKWYHCHGKNRFDRRCL